MSVAGIPGCKCTNISPYSYPDFSVKSWKNVLSSIERPKMDFTRHYPLSWQIQSLTFHSCFCAQSFSASFVTGPSWVVPRKLHILYLRQLTGSTCWSWPLLPFSVVLIPRHPGCGKSSIGHCFVNTCVHRRIGYLCFVRRTRSIVWRISDLLVASTVSGWVLEDTCMSLRKQ